MKHLYQKSISTLLVTVLLLSNSSQAQIFRPDALIPSSSLDVLDIVNPLVPPLQERPRQVKEPTIESISTLRETSQLEALNALNEKSQYSSHINKTMIKMLNKKLTDTEEDLNNWQRRSEPKSNLHKDYLIQSNESDSSAFAAITGKSSVNAALQRNGSVISIQDQKVALEEVTQAIESFKRNEGTYPKKLSDFSQYKDEFWSWIWMDGERINVSEIADLFDYTTTEGPVDENIKRPDSLLQEWEIKSFDLKIKEITSKETGLTIGSIKPFEITSHDFAQIAKEEGLELQNKNKIFDQVPSDSFLVYFEDMSAYQQLRSKFTPMINENFGNLPIPTPLEMEQVIGARLGIPEPERFLSQINSMAFVSDDLNFYGGTDFALILDLKIGGNEAARFFLPEGDLVHQEVNGYYIIATSQQYFDQVSRPKASMGGAEDFQYTYAKLEAQSGFVFLSDAFIRKMTSPEYRINYQRKKLAREKLVELQYLVWGYKGLKGRFPVSLQSIETEGYTSFDVIRDVQDFNISQEGIVSHQTWGSLQDPTSIGSVSVSTITQAEKDWYENGVNRYQLQYSRFMDPVGVGLTVQGDLIKIHTVILPLAETEEYETFRKFIGGEDEPTQDVDIFAQNPGNMSALAAIQFDSEPLFWESVREIIKTGNRFGEIKTKRPAEEMTQDELREVIFEIISTQLEEIKKEAKGETSPEALAFLQLLEAFDYEQYFDDLAEFSEGSKASFVGLGGSTGLTFPSLFNFDGYIGFDFQGKTLDTQILQSEMGPLAEVLGVDRDIISFLGVFDSNSWIKSSYLNKPFYLYPAFFINVYQFSQENKGYVTISPLTLVKIMSQEKPQGAKFKTYSEYLGPGHVKLIVKPSDYSSLIESFAVQEAQNLVSNLLIGELFDLFGGSSNSVSQPGSYMREFQDLSALIGMPQALAIYKSVPSELGGQEVTITNNQIEVGGVSFVEFSSNAEDYTSWQKIRKEASANLLLTISNITKSVHGVGVRFNFTAHGADIKMILDLRDGGDSLSDQDPVFQNEEIKHTEPNTTNDQFEAQSLPLFPKTKSLMLWVGGLLILLIGLMLGVILAKRKKPTPTSDSN